MRRLLVATMLALSACNQSGVPGGDRDLRGGEPDLAIGAGDLPAIIDLSTANGDLGGFCGDPNSARIRLNNMLANSPAVIANALILNCCDSAALEWDSMQIAT